MMEDVGDEVEDGSIPDLTQVDNFLSRENMIMTDSQIQMPVIDTSQSKATEDEVWLGTGQVFQGTKEKLLSTCANHCNDMKTALNGSCCLDTNQSKGTHTKQIVSSYIFQINLNIF